MKNKEFPSREEFYDTIMKLKKQREEKREGRGRKGKENGERRGEGRRGRMKKKEGDNIMGTFEVMSLMISFGMFVIAVLSFHNHKDS